jgi:hypothetical protein
VHSTVIPEKDISADLYVFFACCNFTKFSSQASGEKILWTCALLINHLCSVLDTSAYASYYLRFFRSIVTFLLKPDSQISFTVFNLQPGLHTALAQSSYITSIFAVHNQIQHSYTHIFNTDMKTKMSYQVIC